MSSAPTGGAAEADIREEDKPYMTQSKNKESIITIEDVKEAVEIGKPLFHDGDVVSHEVYSYLVCNVSATAKKTLFSELSQYKVGSGSGKLKVITKCLLCGKEEEHYLTRTGFNGSEANFVLSYEKRIHEKLFGWHLHSNKELGDDIKRCLDYNIERRRIENLLPIVCEDCYNKAADTYKKDWDDFYDDPLEWVNTHEPNEQSWKWDKVEKLYLYPKDYTDVKEGYKFCGVRYIINNRSVEMYEAKFDQYRKYKSKIVQMERCMPIKEYVFNKQKECNIPDDINDSRYKSFVLAEEFLNGLCNEADLGYLINYVADKISILADQVGAIEKSKCNRFAFGKYKGYPVHLVIDLDRQYIDWLLNNNPTFHLRRDELLHYQGLEWHDMDEQKPENDFEVTGDSSEINQEMSDFSQIVKNEQLWNETEGQNIEKDSFSSDIPNNVDNFTF